MYFLIKMIKVITDSFLYNASLCCKKIYSMINSLKISISDSIWFFLLIQKNLVLFGGSFGDDVTDSALWIINPGKN